MKKKGFTPEQIITMLREAEVLLSQGGHRGRSSKKAGCHRADLLPVEKRARGDAY
jgi:hypothetical protein